MRAIVQERYGSADVLALREVERPVAADGEVLLRVQAASMHPDVWHVLRGRPYVMRLAVGLRRPRGRVPGIDAAGVVEAVGPGVTRLRPGDEVFGETIRGYQWRNGGAFAEYAAAPEAGLAPRPSRLTFAEAAAVPTSGLIAHVNVREARVGPGQRVLVNGAGGGVGIFAVQLARAAGAEVTGVDAAAKLDLVRALAPGGRYVLIAHDGDGTSGRWLGSLPRVLGLVARSAFDRRLPRPDLSPLDKLAGLEALSESKHGDAGGLRHTVSSGRGDDDLAESEALADAGERPR